MFDVPGAGSELLAGCSTTCKDLQQC
jgi:hypothetical protein